MKRSSARLTRFVIGAIATLLLVPTSAPAQRAVAAPRSVPVTVVNPATAPVPVAPPEMAGIPVQLNATLVVPAGEFFDTADLYTPPAGKLLIIEYMTIAVDSRNEAEQAVFGLQASLAGDLVLHRLEPLPPLIVTGIGSGRGIAVQKSLRAYSDGVVRFVYQRGTGFDDERAVVQVTMSGRLVNSPLP